jgi:hypothetical protein
VSQFTRRKSGFRDTLNGPACTIGSKSPSENGRPMIMLREYAASVSYLNAHDSIMTTDEWKKILISVAITAAIIAAIFFAFHQRFTLGF